MLRARRARWCVPLLALAVLAGACGDDDGDGGGATTTTAAGDTTTTAATDDGGETTTTAAGGEEPSEGAVGFDESGRLVPAECQGENNADPALGVTETSINVAMVAIDYSPLADIGFAASGSDVTQWFKAYVDDLNEKGGICGRTIDYQPVLYDILRREGGQACVRVTEDRPNAIVLVQGGTPEAVCIAETGTVTYAQHDFTEADVAGVIDNIFLRSPSFDEQVRATTQWAIDSGELEGKKVGVWYGAVFPSQGDAVEEIALPMLDEAGVDYISFRTDFTGPSDPQGNTVLVAAASEFASQGIDVLLNYTLSTNHAGMKTELASRDVTPVFLSAPISGNTANAVFAEAFQLQEISDGERIVSFMYSPEEDPGDLKSVFESCNAQYTDITGETIEFGRFDYQSLANICTQFDMTVAVLSLVGGEVTREKLIEAFESLPPHPMGPTYAPEAFSADKHFSEARYGIHLYDGSNNSYETIETFEVE